MTTELLRPVTGHKVLTLWPFQEEAIESLRVAARTGKRRIILCAPTGSGKTEMAIHLIQEAQAKGSRVTFVVDGISLYRQRELRESELRFQQVLSNLTIAQQTIERMSRALPAPEESGPEPRRSRNWWPWRRTDRGN